MAWPGPPAGIRDEMSATTGAVGILRIPHFAAMDTVRSAIWCQVAVVGRYTGTADHHLRAS